MNDAPPDVSIIVPVFNDAARLEACLDALELQSYASDDYEIIVVDNGSDVPPDEAVAGHPRARLIAEHRGGSYAARNAGMKHARGRHLAFTDADCIPTPRWLEEGLSLLKTHSGMAVVGGNIEVFAADESRPGAAEMYDIIFGLQQERYVLEEHYAATASMFTSRDVFETVGVFDGTLQSGGDHEWGKRAYALGIPVVYSTTAVVRHPARACLREVLVKRRRLSRGGCDLAVRHGLFLFRYMVVLAKILPSWRYRISVVLRDKRFRGTQSMRLLLMVVFLHYYDYAIRLCMIPSILKRRLFCRGAS